MFFNEHTSSVGIYLDDDVRNTKLGISASKPSAADLEMLQNDRLKFLHNPRIAYLNINSLRNKVIDLQETVKDLDYLVISETKFDESFPNFQFKFNGYGVKKERRDRHKHGGRLLNLLGKALSAKD